MSAVLPAYEGAAAAVRHAVRAGQRGRSARRGRRARAEGARCNRRGSAHIAFGIKVHPLRCEAGEGGEVALPRRLEKSRIRLGGQPSALSASQEQGGIR